MQVNDDFSGFLLKDEDADCSKQEAAVCAHAEILKEHGGRFNERTCNGVF